MSDDELEHENQHQLQEFNPRVFVGGNATTYLRDFGGEDLHEVLPESFDSLFFEGNVDSTFNEYNRVLALLQTNRRWRRIQLSDVGMERATPDFLSLVVLAQTKSDEVCLANCPLDRNFFACFTSGIQTYKFLSVGADNIPISSEAATVWANGLASSTSLERLEIQERTQFFEDDDAGLRLAEGIQRNNSLKDLIVHETSIGSAATKSIIRTVLEGGLPKLSFLSITFKARSDCSSLATKLMSSDRSSLETLIIGCRPPRSVMLPEEDGTRGGNVNRRLKKLIMWDCSLNESYLTSVLSTMPMLEAISLNACGITDLTLIIDFLCLPNCAVKSLSLRGNNIGLDEVEKFVSRLGEMPSLSILNIGRNPWCNDERGEERIERIVQKVSRCWNVEKFIHLSYLADEPAAKYNLMLNLRINSAWRRDLCYKKLSKNVPPNLLPLVAARALRRIEPSFGPNIIFSLLQERRCDLMH